MIQLAGNTAIVTGGSRGIGKSIAEKLATLSCSVVIMDISPDVEEVAQEIQSLTASKVIGIRSDVTDFNSCSRFYTRAISELGVSGIDILVNNAGIVRDSVFTKMTFEQWDTVMKTDLYGIFNCTRTVVEGMVKKNYGRIISISSISSLGNVGQTNYSAAKAGIVGFTKSLAKELARYGITVNAVAPGLIDTTLVETIPEKIMASLVDRIPMKRLGTPNEVANLVVFLASREASYITGESINISGGFFF